MNKYIVFFSLENFGNMYKKYSIHSAIFKWLTSTRERTACTHYLERTRRRRVLAHKSHLLQVKREPVAGACYAQKEAVHGVVFGSHTRVSSF